MISYLNPENCGGDFQEVALIMTIQIFLRNKNKTEKPKEIVFEKQLCLQVIFVQW